MINLTSLQLFFFFTSQAINKKRTVMKMHLPRLPLFNLCVCNSHKYYDESQKLLPDTWQRYSEIDLTCSTWHLLNIIIKLFVLVFNHAMVFKMANIILELFLFQISRSSFKNISVFIISKYPTVDSLFSAYSLLLIFTQLCTAQGNMKKRPSYLKNRHLQFGLHLCSGTGISS